MEKYEIIEFSKIYKRIMEIELTLKARVKHSLSVTYPNKMFYRLIPFLKSIPHNKYIAKTKKNINRDRINDIINSNKTEEEKLDKLLNIIYLSDLLLMLAEYKQLFSDRKFINYLYYKKVDHNYIKKYAVQLRNLRNTVMHFDINNYLNNKKLYLEALNFWENLLFCTNSFIHELPQVKPKTMTILKLIAKECPEILEMDDRIICDVFDDIAFINGLPISELPPYWSIGRGIYEIKRRNKLKKK